MRIRFRTHIFIIFEYTNWARIMKESFEVSCSMRDALMRYHSKRRDSNV